MSNSLTRRTTLGLFPLVLGVLLRHYYSKLAKDKTKGCVAVPLRSKELMYDEAFNIIRVSYHPPSFPSHPLLIIIFQNFNDALARYTSLALYTTR
jgi:hypothetical protein